MDLRVFRRLIIFLPLWFIGAGAWIVPPAGADVGEPQLANASARELWRISSDQILSGDFASAMTTLEKIERLEPGHEEVASVITWMKDARTLEKSREALRAATYEYYVKRTLETIQEAREADEADESLPEGADEAPATSEGDATSEAADDAASATEPVGDEIEDDSVDGLDTEGAEPKGRGYKWNRALRYAISAKDNAKDEDTFRAEPWLDEIVEHSLIQIERHKEKGEWSDALTLYHFLHTLYPDRPAYEEGMKVSGKRAHLDFVYGPKSDWRGDLRDVTAGVVPQIVDRIDQDYVEEPDFKKIAAEGIDQLIILAEAESLSTTFPALSDRDRVSHFVARLKGLKRTRIDTKSSLRARDVKAIFRRILAANEDSLRLPDAVLVDEFIAGLLGPLDDFTSVIWPAEVEDFNKNTRGEFVGVGIQITQGIGQPLRVESPLEDSPAYRAGIKPGDLITAVDGEPTVEMNINQAIAKITGEPGTRVTLTVKDGVTGEEHDVVLMREHIKLRTVRGAQRDDSHPTGWEFMIDPEAKIAYVRVGGFMDRTVEDLEAAIEQMTSEGCRGLILDLRFNPGGLLTAAVKMSELFIEEGDPIVRTKGRNRQQNMEITAKSGRRIGDWPMIVLVNEYSASASEIVAGALAGLKEACVVGTRTFGKGSVQNLIPIADNRAYLKLTTAHYYLCDRDRPGDCWYLLHKKKGSKVWGVEPHVIVKVIPRENAKILRLRREKDVLRGIDQSEVPEEVLDRRPTSQPEDPLPEDPNPDVDPQLAVALNMMRIKLMSKQPWALPPREVRAISQNAPALEESVKR